jgi:hypothetical protein
LGKFALQVAYHDAIDYFSAGDIDSAISEFLRAAENPILSPEEKQEALFSVAYFMAQSGYGDIETILGFLTDALEAAPMSENAPVIISIIDQLKAQQALDAGGE